MEPKTSAQVCGMGHSMKRKEDPRFIRGRGNYVDDIQLPACCTWTSCAAVRAREDQVHQRRQGAESCPALLAVITGETLAKYNLHWMPTLMSDTQMVLPTEKVMYQAQEVAAVIATDRYAAADGSRGGGGRLRPAAGRRRSVQGAAARKRSGPAHRKKDKKDNRIFHWEARRSRRDRPGLRAGRRGG